MQTASKDTINPTINPTACVLVIGNELLSGQTQDENVLYLAKGLYEKGIDLVEVRFLRDVSDEIEAAVLEAHHRYSYIFTTGGIGPTHDDITVASIAKAFARPLGCALEAYHRMLQRHPNPQAPEALARMSVIPCGATLIPNTVSSAPGLHLHNVYIFAGVPRIMRAMFDTVAPSLKGGRPRHCREVIVQVVEALLAHDLESLQKAYPRTEIGSYPFGSDAKSYGVRVVIKGFVEEDVLTVEQRVQGLARSFEGAAK